ncbi:hypothetical protein GGF42_006366 [Coemansia sp. RSA 2424]|nr:hypothetical protein GGF42_006366 [Coemansia sp. RSA 2424]
MFTRVAERAKRIEDATKAVESKPKSPLSAFHLYYKDSYAGIIKDNPDLNYSQVLATARDRWRHADSATRLIYKDRAEEQKIRYAIEMAAYNDRAADRRNIYDIEQPDNAAAHDPGAEPTTVKKRGKRAANTASQGPNAEQTASPRKKKARRASTNAKEGESGKKRKPTTVAQVATPAMPSTLFD